jgi:SSS family transporter
VSAQIDATGSAFESFLDWNYFTGAIVGFLIVLTYIFSGGFVAVAWSDLFQGLVMLIGLVALPIVAYFSISSDVSISQELTKLDPSLLNIWGEGGLTLINVFTILGFVFIGLGFMGSPQLFVRFMSIKGVSEIKKGRWVAFVFTILTDSCAVLIGIFGRYLLTSIDANPEDLLGNGGQDVLPLLVEKIMPLTLIGLYIAAVLSAIMSTIDSLLVVASSAISRDFYQQIYKPKKTEAELAKISKIITLLLAVFALIIAMIVAITTPERTIFWFVIFGWSGIAATFCPTIILSLFWKKFNAKGAIASMITGFLSVPLFKFGFTSIDGIGIYFEKLGELGPSFFLAILVGVIVSSITSEQDINNEVKEITE